MRFFKVLLKVVSVYVLLTKAYVIYYGLIPTWCLDSIIYWC